MAATNDLIYSKLAARFPTEGKSIGDLLSRYQQGALGQPGGIYLTHPGVTANDFVFTASKAQLNIGGRIWLAADVALDDWTPAAAQTLLSKYTALFNLKSYLLQILTTGVVRAVYSPDGATDRTFDSTVNLAGQGNGTRLAVGVDIQPNDGGGNRTATFYTAPGIDGPWVQLGAVVSQVGAESIFTGSSANLAHGTHAFLSPGNQIIGKSHACEVRNGGINGTIVAKPRFDRESELGHVGIDDGYGNLWVPQSVNTAWTTGGRFATDDTADLDFGNNDLDIRIKVAQADWTHAGVTHWFVHQGSHTSPVPDLSWTFSIHSDGRLRTAVSPDGTLTSGFGPTMVNPVGFTDGTEHFIRSTVDLDDGAGNSVFNYYESLDNGQSWVDIGGGNLVEPLGPITLFNPSTPLIVNGLTPSTTQNTKYLEIRRGINGPVIVKADFTKAGIRESNFIDETGRNWVNLDAPRNRIVQDAAALPRYEDYVAHVAAASPSLNVGDDENAFWDAFVP